ncbi:MAG: SDR family NAD(P)-dependent oxidoreductase [Burkholderiaceae bacterium]
MDLGLEGKRALVTGASKGIGRAVAEGFAAEGAQVSICARDGAALATAIADLQKRGVTAFGQAIDVADAAALAGWVSASANALGGIDALVCNVSALAVGDSPETWEKSFRVDMMHTVNAVAAAVPFLEKSSCPSITIISSVSGFEVDFAAGSYGAMKAALIHYAKGLSRQLVANGIRVNCVSPGNTYFDGGIWQSIEKDLPDLFANTVKVNPTGKFGTGRGGQWRGVPGQPDGQPHLGHQPRDRRCAHRCRLAPRSQRHASPCRSHDPQAPCPPRMEQRLHPLPDDRPG